MNTKMPKVKSCDATDCAYNIRHKCHAIAITIGGWSVPACDTSMIAQKKGGVPNTTAGVGACKIENCQFNKSLQCTAKWIRVKRYTLDAECVTIKEK
ncbi:DUF1540 domain-containing protein [bacterium]|nr:DUF1540 domain-containing protein [bacterium]NIN91418.1 DUF1540 domain-containing protein [bacterium]NIO17828.1 DUF1540 domain-containing protein [bacterium]NIO72809.1 DUF1540 domain-containing protein [bacterium]